MKVKKDLKIKVEKFQEKLDQTPEEKLKENLLILSSKKLTKILKS